MTRRFGVEHFPLQARLFGRFGVFPIRDHYYEPRFRYPADFDFDSPRNLPLDLELDRQLEDLKGLAHLEELEILNQLDLSFPSVPADSSNHSFPSTNSFTGHPNFCAADADLYFLMIRNFQPKQIIEVGSGFSTSVALKGLEDGSTMVHDARMICIEPFEMPFLEQTKGIRLIRKPVEQVGIDLFESLGPNDILFIDSSHIIRPGNDLLFLMFEVLPRLKSGVIIHFHDIFSPYHYPQDWLEKKMRFWNEQYLLEAFLCNNKNFKVLFSLHALAKKAPEQLRKTLRHFSPEQGPSSFWIQRL